MFRYQKILPLRLKSTERFEQRFICVRINGSAIGICDFRLNFVGFIGIWILDSPRVLKVGSGRPPSGFVGVLDTAGCCSSPSEEPLRPVDLISTIGCLGSRNDEVQPGVPPLVFRGLYTGVLCGGLTA